MSGGLDTGNTAAEERVGAAPSVLFRMLAPFIFLWAAWLALSELVRILFADWKGAAAGDFALFLLCGAAYISIATASTAWFIIEERRSPAAAARTRRFLLISCGLLMVLLVAYTRVIGRLEPVAANIGTANLLTIAILLGTWIVAPLKRASELVPVAIVMTLADVYSVFMGPSSKIAESLGKFYRGGMAGPPPPADFLLVKLILPGSAVPAPAFGVADWIFVAFLTAAAARFGFDDNLIGPGLFELERKRLRPFVLPVAALALFAAVAAANVLGYPIPALPIVAGAFMSYVLVKYPDARRLTKSDWIATAAFSGALLALMALGKFVK
ncbi:MAG: hypothetical protein HRF49_03910 [bacterium]|jgi:hypothetical protein